jgi:hypothetical protein
MKFAFITRHQPTQAQIDLAAEQGIELECVGDADAFDTASYPDVSGYDGVIVVHPMLALRMIRSVGYSQKERLIGVFENANRAPEGERPQFEAKALHIMRLNGEDAYCISA